MGLIMGEMSKLLKFNIMLGENEHNSPISVIIKVISFIFIMEKRKPGNRYKSSNYAAH